MSNLTIPPKSRMEWNQMVTGVVRHSYTNYVLQMKVHQASKDVAANKITASAAVDALYDICSKYALAVQVDLKAIFKNW